MIHDPLSLRHGGACCSPLFGHLTLCLWRSRTQSARWRARRVVHRQSDAQSAVNMSFEGELNRSFKMPNIMGFWLMVGACRKDVGQPLIKSLPFVCLVNFKQNVVGVILWFHLKISVPSIMDVLAKVWRKAPSESSVSSVHTKGLRPEVRGETFFGLL